jgi:hypothetical protein
MPLENNDGQSSRSKVRHYLTLVIIGTATSQGLGFALSIPTPWKDNDASRWCTVWSLLERGTYAIDGSPWETIDKVQGPAPFQAVAQGAQPVKHFYSSKPPLMPTLVAGLIYPFRTALQIPLEHHLSQERLPAYTFYFKPVVILLNIVPFCVFLVLYSRVIDRYAISDWSYMVSLAAAAWGTQLFTFNGILNNHTVATYSGFFSLYSWMRISYDDARQPILYVMAGFFAAFCACNELPAALFGILMFGMLLTRSPRPTLLYFVPAAAIPCLAFLLTQYLAFGTLVPIITETVKGYTAHYEGSYWNAPEGIDNIQEPKLIYLFHLLLGGHGFFSLTPILCFSVVPVVQHLRTGENRLSNLAWLTMVLTVLTIALYTWRTSNYGGLTQGMRWLFWLFPFWLVFLPQGLDLGRERPWFRVLSLMALMVSVFSVSFGIRNPWSSPWLRIVYRGMTLDL